MWALAVLAPLCVLIETWAELAQPDLMSTIVDRGILGGERGIIMPTGMKMVSIIVAGAVCGLISIYAAGRVSYRLGADLRREVYDRLMRIGFEDVDRLGTASLMTRLGDDVNRVQAMVQQSMRLLFRAPLMFAGSVAMAIMIDVNISVIIICVMLTAIAVVTGVLRRTYAMFVKLQKARDRFTRMAREILAGVRVVKTYTNEELEQERFDSVNNAQTAQSVKVGYAMACLMPIVSFSLNIGTILILYIGGGEVVTGNISVGGIMAAINYMAQIQIAIMMAQFVIMGITQARASVERIEEVLNTPTEDDRDTAGTGARQAHFRNGDIELRGVDFAYAGGRKVLDGITAAIPCGRTTAIIGETGSGKTTLVNLIAGNYEPTSGNILIGGTELRTTSRRELRSHISLAMQTPLLFSGTLRENLRLGNPSATDGEIMEAANTAHIADYINAQQDGLDGRVEQGGKNLSGGQRQRVCLARALVKRPDILILDDSLSALDGLTESDIRKALTSLRLTKIIVSQRIADVRQADLIIMLKAGRVAATGSHEELMRKSPEYRETYETQMS